jgi:hypothetical protein
MALVSNYARFATINPSRSRSKDARTTNLKRFSVADKKRSHLRSVNAGGDFLRQLSSYFHLFLPIDASSHRYNFIIHYDCKPIKVEVEHKLIWLDNNGPYPCPNLHVPCRQWRSEAQTYIQFNIAFDALAITRMNRVLNSTTEREPWTSAKTTDEQFYAVPLDQVHLFTLDNHVWMPTNPELSFDVLEADMGWDQLKW